MLVFKDNGRVENFNPRAFVDLSVYPSPSVNLIRPFSRSH